MVSNRPHVSIRVTLHYSLIRLPVESEFLKSDQVVFERTLTRVWVREGWVRREKKEGVIQSFGVILDFGKG